MNLTKYEQSGFVIETSSGFRLGIDIAMLTPLEKLDEIKQLDAFIVSHLHPDHLSAAHIQRLAPKEVYLSLESQDASKLKTKTIKTGDKIKIGEVEVEVFSVDHGPNVPNPKENFGFLITANSEKIYFAGDMFNPNDVSELEVDYALIPVGGFYTFGPKEAAAFAKSFKKIGKVIPMHYDKFPDAKIEFEKITS